MSDGVTRPYTAAAERLRPARGLHPRVASACIPPLPSLTRLRTIARTPAKNFRLAHSETRTNALVDQSSRVVGNDA